MLYRKQYSISQYNKKKYNYYFTFQNKLFTNTLLRCIYSSYKKGQCKRKTLDFLLFPFRDQTDSNTILILNDLNTNVRSYLCLWKKEKPSNMSFGTTQEKWVVCIQFKHTSLDINLCLQPWYKPWMPISSEHKAQMKTDLCGIM